MRARCKLHPRLVHETAASSPPSTHIVPPEPHSSNAASDQSKDNSLKQICQHNPLTFSLPTPPAGASINSTNGVLTWRPAVAFSPATQSVAVAVAERGNGTIIVRAAMACFAEQGFAATTLDDIAAIVALYRPGPLEAKMEERYALRKNGLETVDYGIFSPDPAEQAQIAKVLDETFGTCLAGDTRIYSLSRGHLIDLRDVKVGEFVQSVDPQTFEATAGEVLNFASMGERDTFAVRLRSGDLLEATSDHLVLTTDGWKCVADLRPGDLVGRPPSAMEPESIDDGPTPERAAVPIDSWIVP